MIRGGQGGGGQAECTALMVFAQPDGQVRWEFKSFQEIFFPTKNAVGTMHLANFCSAWPPNQVGIFCQDFTFSVKMPLINIGEKIYFTLSLRISVGKLGVYPAWQRWPKSGCKSNAFRQSFKFFHENVFFCQISSCIPLLISDMLQFIMVGSWIARQVALSYLYRLFPQRKNGTCVFISFSSK